MSVSVPEVSADSALAAIEAFAFATAKELDGLAVQANTKLFQAANNMNWSNSIVASISNPDFQNSIRNSIQGLQNDIQNTINDASASVNQNVRAATIVTSLSNVANAAGFITTAVGVYNASQSDSTNKLGGAVLSSLSGAAAGWAADIVGTALGSPIAAAIAGAITGCSNC